MAIELTPKQKALLDGESGDVKAKIMKTLIMYGEVFGATKLVPVTSEMGHLVTSFGLSMMKPIYSLMDTLIEANVSSDQKFTVDPRPLDPNVPTNFLQDILFKFMYSKQKDYENQLNKIGLVSKDGFTCTCYMDEIGNKPMEGEILSWAESSAVVYANSVLGARCNRNSGIIELFGSIVGYVPEFGLLTDQGRQATWVVEINTTQKPEAQLLGSAIGMRVMEDVPYIKGLDKWLGTELNDDVCSYLKDMGAATASNGAVGLYHVDNLTPEAKAKKESLIKETANKYIIDDDELKRVKDGYPCIWKDKTAKPKLCFIGCPHLSPTQLVEWSNKIETELVKNGTSKIAIPTVMTTAPAVLKQFEKTKEAEILKNRGVILSSICPLMYMNNPLCGKMPVITCSNKLRTYSSARFYSEAEILNYITKGELENETI